MAASNVEIVNLALSKVGSATIADWNEATKEGRTATAVFTNVREWLQERYPWNFCLTRVSLTFSNATGTYYSNEYTYYSALTNLSNMLRVYEVDNNPLVSYAIENDNFYTSTTPLVIRYIKKITDPTLFPPAFTNCFAVALAMEIAPILTGDWNTRVALKNELKMEIQQAYLLNAIEGRTRIGKGAQSLDLAEATWQNP